MCKGGEKFFIIKLSSYIRHNLRKDTKRNVKGVRNVENSVEKEENKKDLKNTPPFVDCEKKKTVEN